MRVFIAVDLSRPVKKEIEKLLKVLKKKHWPVKWLETEKLHLTLVFLADQKKTDLSLIKQACQKAASQAVFFKVSFKGLGCFTSYDYPRVLWLGLKGDLKSLAQLTKDIKKNLKAANIEFKPRTFSPHITLARVKNCPIKQRREIGRQLKRLKKIELKEKIKITKIIIYQSQLSPKGSQYFKLFKLVLKF